jgi:OmpA-like transmembrane domain.
MKRLFFMLSVLLISTGVFAQSFEWGAKTGLNLSTLTNANNAKIRPGLYIGVYGEYGVNDFFGIQGELLYSMMGAKGTTILGGIIPSGITPVYKTDYIVLPILAKVYLMENFSVDFGPQFGYMVSAKLKLSDGSNPGYDLYEHIDNKFDLSVGMGVSYKLPYNIGISARYNLGLTEINEGKDPKNSVIQLGISYRF